MLRTIFVLAIAAIGFAYALRGSFFGLLLYLWIAYFRPENWVWNGDPIRALNLSYIAGLLTVGLMLFSRERWRGGLRVGLLALFLIHTLVSAVFGINTPYAWPFWVEFLKEIVVTYLIVCLVNEPKRFRLVLVVIALSLGVEAAKQGWLDALTSPGAQNTNTHPALGDNNGIAVGMLMLVPIFTTLAAIARTRTERFVHVFLALGVLYRGLVTYSRGGFLACAALGLVYLFRSPRKGRALAAVAVSMMLIGPMLPQSYWQRMKTIDNAADNADAADSSVLGRLHFWKVAVDMANAQPFFGIGHNSFNVVYDRYDDSGGEFGRGRSVHSVWFGLLAELGYPGLLLFLIQLGLAFRACATARRAAKVNPSFSVLGRFAFAIEAALVVYAVGGTFLPFQYLEMYWHVIGLSIALHFLAKDAIAAAVPPERIAPAAGLPALGLAS